MPSPTPPWSTVTIVGVGLIGGSIGLALRERNLAQRVVGVGRRKASLTAAKRRGAIDASSTDIARGVQEAELVVVCTPVGLVVDHTRQAAAACPPGTLLTDAGSTKQQIVNELAASELENGVFVGSHPLAGSEKSGVAHADGGLFVDRLVVLTPTRRTPKQALARIDRFWKSLGARTEIMTPSAHDAALAASSHLPHLVASALAACTPEKALPLAAGGWRDSTRIAAGDIEMWRQIFEANAGCLLKSLDKFETQLAAFRRALETGDERSLTKLLTAGKKRREALGS